MPARDAVYHGPHADLDPVGILAVAEIGREPAADDVLCQNIVALIVAGAEFEPGFPVFGNHEQQDAVVALGIADAPFIEEPGGEVLERGRRCMLVQRLVR